jgi:hypothetical protein
LVRVGRVLEHLREQIYNGWFQNRQNLNRMVSHRNGQIYNGQRTDLQQLVLQRKNRFTTDGFTTKRKDLQRTTDGFTTDGLTMERAG